MLGVSPLVLCSSLCGCEFGGKRSRAVVDAPMMSLCAFIDWKGQPHPVDPECAPLLQLMKRFGPPGLTKNYLICSS